MNWLEIRRSDRTWRLIEVDTGLPCAKWLPGDEPDLPIDGGGWELSDYWDAIGFALGVLRWRANFGFLGGFTVADIDRARAGLDVPSPGRAPIRRDRIAINIVAA